MIYTDYASMQKAAQRRVYDMQQRSKRAIADDFEEANKACEKDRSDTCSDERDEETQCSEVSVPKGLSRDRLLIAVLIALLISEGNDIKTVAALLYLLM